MIENVDKYLSNGPDRVDISLVIDKFARLPTIQFIGTTSPFFYQKFIFVNEKINQLFTKIDVQEVGIDEAFKILLEVVPTFEKKNQVVIPYETVKNTIDKSEFYITNIPFPEKAIDLLDQACAYVNLKRQHGQNGLLQVLPEVIDVVLSEKTHIPTRLTEEMKSKLINLENLLEQQIIHQNEAMEKLAAAMRRSFVLLGKRKKPIASFLFLGPTGVGKTETAKALSRLFFGSEKYLVRFDMSLFQSKNDIPHLLGSADSQNPGLLTKTLRENPYAVLLLDEIEKANKDLLNIFLTLLDEGYLTDGYGKKIDCKNLIVIATSNAGSNHIFSQSTAPVAGGSTEQSDYEQKQPFIDYLVNKNFFSPEFLNRFDGVIVYQPLSATTLEELAKKMIDRIINNLYRLYHIHIVVSPETINNLLSSTNQKFGARDLEHVITHVLEDKIAKLILENKVKEEETINL